MENEEPDLLDRIEKRLEDMKDQFSGENLNFYFDSYAVDGKLHWTVRPGCPPEIEATIIRIVQEESQK